MADNVNTSSLTGQLLPSVYITEMAIRKGQSVRDGNTVNIKLVVRDVIENNDSSSWYFNSDFTKYLQIKIIQSTNEKLTKTLEELEYFFENPNYTPSELQRYKEFATIQILDFQKDNFDLKDYSKINSQTGERIYEIDYETFLSVRRRTDHLTYFCFVVLDLERMSEDYGMKFGGGYTAPRGNVTQELLISNGKVNTTSYLYFVEETGQIWTGPFYVSEDGETLKTGEPGLPRLVGPPQDNPLSKTLRREEVINPKVKDLRKPRQTEEGLPDLKPALREFQKSSEKLLNRDQIATDAPDSYISEGLVSPARNGSVDLLFHIDLRKLVREQSAFGSIFDTSTNPVAIERMYALSKIKDLKILRRRVSKVRATNKLGTDVYSNIFDESREVVKTLIVSSDLDGVIEQRSNDDASIKEIEGVMFSDNVRTFTVTDSDMEDVTDGFYQYGVSLEADDGVVIFLNEQLDKMIEVKKEFDLYYYDAISPRYILPNGSFSPLLNRKYTRIARRQSRRLSREAISAFLPWNKAIRTYIDVYTSVTQLPDSSDFYSTIYAMINPTTGSEEGIYAFLQMMAALIEQLSTTLVGKRTIKQSELNLQKTQTKNLYRVSTLFIDKFFKDIHDSNLPRNYGFDFVGKDSKQDVGVKSLVYQDILQRADEEIGMFWNSLDLQATSETLRNENQGGEANLTEKDQLFDLRTNRLGFFTPATISAGSYSVDRLNVGANLWNSKNYNAVAANITAIESGKYTMPNVNPILKTNPKSSAVNSSNSNSQKTQSNAVDNILSQLGIVIVDSEEESQGRENANSDSTIVTSDILGTSDPINTIIRTNSFDESQTDNAETNLRKELGAGKRNFENKVAIANIFVNNAAATNALSDSSGSSKKSNFKTVTTPSIKQYDLFSTNNVVDSLRNSPLTSDQVSLIPNQIKSLMFSKSATTKNNWMDLQSDPMQSPETSQTMRYNFQTIGKIEVFMGFEKDKNENNVILKPKFELLTDDILENTTNKVLLCRVSEYKNSILGVGVNSSPKMRIYDNVFVLSPNEELLFEAIKEAVEQQEQEEADTKKAENTFKNNENIRYAQSGKTMGTQIIQDNFFKTQKRNNR